MVTDELLKKIQWNAKRAIDDVGKGATITLAMDPVVMFALATELLKLRQIKFYCGMDLGREESGNAEPG